MILHNMDLHLEGHARVIVSKIATTSTDAMRMEAIDHLRRVMRTSPDLRRSSWMTRIIVSQLYDFKLSVARRALVAVEEACEDPDVLANIVKLEPALAHFQDEGTALLTRFVADSEGFERLQRCGFLERELERWRKTQNLAYVAKVEALLSAALTVHSSSDYAECDENCRLRAPDWLERCRDDPQPRVHAPHHFYASLCRLEKGAAVLKTSNHIADLVAEIARACSTCRDASALPQLKAALWALGHIASCHYGVPLLDDFSDPTHGSPIEMIVFLAENHSVLTVRG